MDVRCGGCNHWINVLAAEHVLNVPNSRSYTFYCKSCVEFRGLKKGFMTTWDKYQETEIPIPKMIDCPNQDECQEEYIENCDNFENCCDQIDHGP